MGRVVLTILGGAISGLISSWAFVGLRPVERPAAASSATPIIQAAPQPATIIREIRTVQGAPSACPMVPETGDDGSASEGTSPRAEIEAQVQELRGEFEANVAMHRNEHVNERWASAKQKQIKDDLQALVSDSRLHAQLSGVACRADSCLATLRWEDPANAKAEALDAAQWPGMSTVGCSRQLLLGGDESGDVRSGTLLYKCSHTQELL